MTTDKQGGDRCLLCGQGHLRAVIEDFRTDFEAEDGSRRQVLVPHVKKNVCDHCGDYILDPESESRISAAQRHALGLLGAQELQAFRLRLNMSQEAIASLLGLGKKTWCRWESNDYFQSEAFDRYLRLLIFVPATVGALELIRNEKRSGPSDLNRTFPYLKDVSSASAFAEQFRDILLEGPFS